MVDCNGVTKATITAQMMEDYPELSGKGFEIGEEIDIGGVPLDGRVEGDAKKVGQCGATCEVTTPTVDGNNGELWEASFVKEYFPKELGNLEKGVELDVCYSTPVKKYSANQISTYADDDPAKALKVLASMDQKGVSTDDLKILKSTLETVIPAAKEDGVETKPLEVTLSMVNEKIGSLVAVSQK